MRHAKNISAFSLVELSIVLVILGLLVGGVLSGQALIRAAELRAFTTETSKHYAAISSFKDKYFAIPGDITNATQFWGVAAGTGTDSTCLNFVKTTKATCNGNGDGRISASSEDALIWQHLANAGLIEGSYTGEWSTNGGLATVPKSKAGNFFWYVMLGGARSATASSFGGDYGTNNFMAFTTSWNVNVFTTTDMWNVDKKLDDGTPNAGKLWSNKGTATYQCTTQYNNIVDTGAQYNLSFASSACMPYFINAL